MTQHEINTLRHANMLLEQRVAALETQLQEQSHTVHAQAVQDLNARERRLSSLVESVPGVVYRCELAPPWRAEFISEAIQALVGHPARAFTAPGGLTLHAIIHPDDLARVAQVVAQAIHDGAVYDLEYRLVHRAGHAVWVHERGCATYDAEGRAPCLDGVFIDISRRRQDALERGRLLAAIEQAAEVIVTTDAEGRIEYVNPAFERTTGYTRAEVLGQNPRLLKSGSHDAAFYALLWQTLSAGKTWQGRFVNKRKDGSLYTAEASISPVRDSSGRTVNYVAVKHDITEHLREHEEKSRLEARLAQAQKMESVGRLAGGVAHDFNNMLGVILGHAEMALLQERPSPPVQAALLEIQKAGQRSANLTRQLLAFARKQTAVPRALDLNGTIEGLLRMLRRLIGEDIELRWRAGAGLWPVRMDPVQVDQILTNLCVNARDAIGGVGRVIVETANATCDTTDCARCAYLVPGDYVLLTVSDTGCGMDPETQARLFEPFFTTKGVGQGTGLGLATVYGVVKQNAGFINVYSEPGQGATFRIYLPRLHDATGSAPEDKAPPVPPRGQETILLVEDEPAILMLGQRMLETLGYHVIAAGSPTEALRSADEHPDAINLLVTDVIMPEMNGRDLALRLQSRHPRMRLLFMSGYTAEIIVHRGVLDQDAGFLSKPFTRDDLARKVRAALEG